MSTRPNSRPPVSPLPRQLNTATTVLDTVHGSVLCIADIRGRLSALNDLAREANASAIIHTGDFGFFEASSLEGNSINDRTLRHLTMYSPLIPSPQRTHLLSSENAPDLIRSTIDISLLSEFPLFLSGQLKLSIPVYTVWGACEDVRVLEKFRAGTYSVHNLHVLDEATTRCLDVGGVKLRLLGLGGAVVPHKMFDNGDGTATIAGGQGTMWTTALQIGELVDTAQRVFDPTETRVLITHASPGREGLIAQLALVCKADLTISAGLHFRYASSWNEFSVLGDFEGFRRKLEEGKRAFGRVWDAVRPQVEAVIDEGQKVLLDKALSVVDRVPPLAAGPQGQGGQEEPAWKNCWNWNLCDAAYGTLLLDVKEGRISAELKSQGFNYAYRRTATNIQSTPNQPTAPLPASNNNNTPGTNQPPTKAATPTPAQEGKESPSPNVNVNPNASAERAEREKNKKKEKKERKAAEKAVAATTSTGTPVDSEAAPTPAAAEGDASLETAAAVAAGPKSPTAASSGGIRTPKTAKPARNPWTIFMRMPVGFVVNEADIRGFFEDNAGKIMKVHLPTAFAGRPRIAYVEFENEEEMRGALGACGDKINDTTIEVKQATDRESRQEPHQHGLHGHHRGGSVRGRGGRGGGAYAARGFAAAGLTRSGFKPGSNGGSAGAEGASAGDN